jgi:hypothetical protein
MQATREPMPTVDVAPDETIFVRQALARAIDENRDADARALLARLRRMVGREQE